MSLPTNLTFTIGVDEYIIASKVNQDNFGVTYRGTAVRASDSTKIVAEVKVKHREEGSVLSRNERHICDATLTYFPADGSPSYKAQCYIHMIFPTGKPVSVMSDVCTGISHFDNPTATTYFTPFLNWEV